MGVGNCSYVTLSPHLARYRIARPARATLRCNAIRCDMNRHKSQPLSLSLPIELPASLSRPATIGLCAVVARWSFSSEPPRFVATSLKSCHTHVPCSTSSFFAFTAPRNMFEISFMSLFFQRKTTFFFSSFHFHSFGKLTITPLASVAHTASFPTSKDRDWSYPLQHLKRADQRLVLCRVCSTA